MASHRTDKFNPLNRANNDVYSYYGSYNRQTRRTEVKCLVQILPLVVSAIFASSSPASTQFDARKPVFDAIGRDDISTLDLYIKSGGALNATNQRGCSLLEVAILSKSVRCQALLLRSGSPVSPFAAAGLGRDADLRDFLKADPKGANAQHNGWPIIFWAIHNDRIETTKLLLGSGASANSIVSDEFLQNVSALHATCGASNGELALLLIRAGAKVDQRDSEGNTPLHYAAMAETSKATQHLLAASASPHVVNHMGQSPFVLGASLGRVETTRELLRYDLDAEQVKVATLVAAAGGHVEILTSIYMSKFSLDVFDSHGETPLSLAIQNNQVNAVKYLLRTGVSLPVISGENMLHLAVRGSSIEIVEALLEKGIDPNLPDEKGRTPIQLAELYHQTKIVKLIQEYQALRRLKR